VSPILFSRRDRLQNLPDIRVTELKSDSVPAEMFRTLRTNVQFSLVDRERAAIVVTSPLAEEGKTLVSSHLGLAFARAGKRVFVVDADFRHPSVHQYFGVPNDVGLAEVLLGDVALTDALKKVQVEDEPTTTMYVLTTGRRPPNPAELLGSRRMATTLTALKEVAELVIVDCPPIVPVTDAGVLAPAVDGTLIVAASSITRRHALQRAVDLLHKTGANILGVVLNFVSGSDSAGYYYAYPYPKAGAAPARGTPERIA
jgi:capsular exopolysaccharide synthesis family protein